MNFEIDFIDNKCIWNNPLYQNEKKNCLGEHYLFDYEHKKTSNSSISSGYNRFYIRKIPYYKIDTLYNNSLFSDLPDDIQNNIFSKIAEPYIKFVHVYKTVYMSISELVIMIKKENLEDNYFKPQIFKTNHIPLMFWYIDNDDNEWKLNIHEKNFIKSNVNQIKITFQNKLPDIELNSQDIVIA